MKTGQWMCNFDGSEYWNDGEFFDTREDAITYGKEEMKQRNKEYLGSFDIGQLQIHIPHIDADTVIDNLQEQACDECGEFADDFLNHLSKEERLMLEERLNVVLEKWLDETENQPTFFIIENTETIEL